MAVLVMETFWLSIVIRYALKLYQKLVNVSWALIHLSWLLGLSAVDCECPFQSADICCAWYFFLERVEVVAAGRRQCSD